LLIIRKYLILLYTKMHVRVNIFPKILTLSTYNFIIGLPNIFFICVYISGNFKGKITIKFIANNCNKFNYLYFTIIQSLIFMWGGYMKNSCIIFPFKRFFCTVVGGPPGDMGVCGRITILNKKLFCERCLFSIIFVWRIWNRKRAIALHTKAAGNVTLDLSLASMFAAFLSWLVVWQTILFEKYKRKF